MRVLIKFDADLIHVGGTLYKKSAKMEMKFPSIR